MRMEPLSTGKVRAMALGRVDFPAPLPPMTVTKSPSCSVRLRSSSAVFSWMVPGKKVLEIFFSSSMAHASFLVGQLILPVWNGQEYGHDQSRDQLQVVGVQAQLQYDLQHEVVDH